GAKGLGEAGGSGGRPSMLGGASRCWRPSSSAYTGRLIACRSRTPGLRTSKPHAAPLPCAGRPSFRRGPRPGTQQAKACERCPVNGGAPAFPLQGLEASRKQQKMRKRRATPATDPPGKSRQRLREHLNEHGQRAACEEHDPEPFPAPGPQPGGDGCNNRGSKDACVVKESTPYRARTQVCADWNDQHDQNE